MRKSIHLLALSFFVLTNSFMTFSQTCDSLVPHFVVDLSSDSDSLWISPPIQRAGLCCGAIAPETCVEFAVTISPAAIGVVFEIYCGQCFIGPLLTKTDCTDQVAVGDTLFFTTSGPHSVTFCKPGNNQYQYGIKSIPDLNSNVLNYEKNYSIIIYPNPTSGIVNIFSDLAIDEIKVSNVFGQIVYQARPNETKFPFQLDTGLYFIAVTSDKKVTTKKLTVMR